MAAKSKGRRGHRRRCLRSPSVTLRQNGMPSKSASPCSTRERLVLVAASDEGKFCIERPMSLWHIVLALCSTSSGLAFLGNNAAPPLAPQLWSHLHDSVSFVTSQAYERLDVCLAHERARSRSAWAAAISAGQVRVDGQVCYRKAESVREGALVEADYCDVDEHIIPEENIELDVLYEDDDLIVVNKAAGMVTHPAPGHRRGTLANALAFRFDAPRAGIVHRLDKDTSGAIVAAKHEHAHAVLSDAFRERTVDKVYLAICAGALPDELKVDGPIARDPMRRDKMIVAENGKSAVSHVKCLATDGAASVAQVNIETGRTHQIRVHLCHIRHPILADDLYGDPTHNARAARPPLKATRPLLHAWQLNIPSPSDLNRRIALVAPPPPDFKRAIGVISGLG